MLAAQRPTWQGYIGAKYAPLNAHALRGELSLSAITAGLSGYLDDDNVMAILLGGSYAKGKARAYSDIDVYLVKRSSNVPFYRQAVVIDGMPYELNFIEHGYCASVMEGMHKSRRASLVYSLAFATVLKGEPYAKTVQALALDVWHDTSSSDVHVQRLITGLQESLVGNLVDFVVEPDRVSAQLVAASMVNDCSALLSLAATGWLHRGHHAVAAIDSDPQSRVLLDELLSAYRRYLREGDNALLADGVCAIVAAADYHLQAAVG